MKKLITIYLLIVTVFTLNAQKISIQRRLDNLKQNGYDKYVDFEINIKQGQTGYKIYKFKKNTNYTILAYSEDTNVTDIDLFIYYPDGKLYMKNDDVSDILMCERFFKLNEEREFKIVVENHKSNRSNYTSKIWLVFVSN